MRVASGEERRGPDAGLEAGGANFSRDFFQATRKFGVGRIPIAERGLKAVVELNHVDRKLGAHRLERLEVGAQRVLGDRVKVVVPGAPSALERRTHARVHPSAGRVGPSRGEARGGLIGGGDEERIEIAMRARRQGNVVENCAGDYFFGTRDGESRKRSGGADESGQDALRDIVAFDDREEFRGLRLGKFRRTSRFALMIDARDEVRAVARMGLRRAYIVAARCAPRLIAVLEKSRGCGLREAGLDFEDRGRESNRLDAAIGDGCAHDRSAHRVFDAGREDHAIVDGSRFAWSEGARRDSVREDGRRHRCSRSSIRDSSALRHVRCKESQRRLTRSSGKWQKFWTIDPGNRASVKVR